MFVELFKAGATGETSSNFVNEQQEPLGPHRHKEKVEGSLFVSGTIGGATVNFDAYDGVDWQPVTYEGTTTVVAITAAGMVTLSLFAERIRARVVGGAASAMKVRFLTNCKFVKAEVDIA